VTLEVVGSNPTIYPLYKIKQLQTKYFINNNLFKKVNIFDFNFLTQPSPKFLSKSIFIYYNFFNKVVPANNLNDNYIFIFNKHK
jgi:hypothetical protein